MIMKTFRAKVGVADLYTNMYVVADEKTKDGILIDAGAGSRRGRSGRAAAGERRHCDRTFDQR